MLSFYTICLGLFFEQYCVKFKHKLCTFLHNFFTVHRDVTTLNWFNKKKIENFDCPTFSSDLNPIKNLWGLLAHLV